MSGPRIAVGAGLVAGAIGVGVAVGVGLSTQRSHQPLVIASTWNSSASGTRVSLLTGSFRTDPQRGFALLQVGRMSPELYTTPAGAGALRLVSASENGWILRSDHGGLALIDNLGAGVGDTIPSFAYLGRRLDPRHLPTIAASGIAVPIRYGAPNSDHQPRYRAVLLVGRALDQRGNMSWKLDGYLAGFSLPNRAPRTRELERPLLGPDGHMYRIDAAAARLVDVSRGKRAVSPLYLSPYQRGCTIWPASNGGHYVACPGSVSLRPRLGKTSTLLRRTAPPKGMWPGWGLVAPSPDGRWLLLEDAETSCGTATWADFLPASGGNLVPAMPDAQTTEALGWLSDSTALIAVQAYGCAGGPPDGIYRVWPGLTSTQHELVVSAAASDATLWG